MGYNSNKSNHISSNSQTRLVQQAKDPFSKSLNNRHLGDNLEALEEHFLKSNKKGFIEKIESKKQTVDN